MLEDLLADVEGRRIAILDQINFLLVFHLFERTFLLFQIQSVAVCARFPEVFFLSADHSHGVIIDVTAEFLFT